MKVLVLKVAGDNVFVIQFRSLTEKARVVSEGPWTFDRSIILMKSPNDSECIGTMEFKDVPIWVQIHNVPFNCLTRSMGRILGASIGKVEEIDCDENDVWTGPFMRIRTVIDINKPLMRGLKIRVSESSSVWCPIMYEKLPDFCFHCGVMGHLHRECHQHIADSHGSETASYGDWLRASIMKKNTGNRWDVENFENHWSRGEGTRNRGRGGRFSNWGTEGRSNVGSWRVAQNGGSGVEQNIQKEMQVGDGDIGKKGEDGVVLNVSKPHLSPVKGKVSREEPFFEGEKGTNSNVSIAEQKGKMILTERTEVMEEELMAGIDNSNQIIRTFKKYRTKLPIIKHDIAGANYPMTLNKKVRGKRKAEGSESDELLPKKSKEEYVEHITISAEAAKQSRRDQ